MNDSDKKEIVERINLRKDVLLHKVETGSSPIKKVFPMYALICVFR